MKLVVPEMQLILPKSKKNKKGSYIEGTTVMSVATAYLIYDKYSISIVTFNLN